MKHIITILILICFLTIYFGGFYLFSQWTEWNFLFIYKNSLIKYGFVLPIFLICFYFSYKIKFKDQETYSTIKIFLARIGVFVLSSVFLCGFFISLLTKILYKTAGNKYFSEMRVVSISFPSKKQTIELVSPSHESIKIKWNRLALRDKLESEKHEISDIKKLSVDDKIKVYGRKNFVGLAIDSIYKIKHF